MPDDALTIVRRMFDAFGRNDPDAALELFDENLEWHPAEDEPETATLHGKEGFQSLALRWMTTFDDFKFEAVEFIDGGECVVVPLRVSGFMRGTRAEVGFEESWVFWVREGKVIEVREYRTKDEALGAAGLTE